VVLRDRARVASSPTSALLGRVFQRTCGNARMFAFLSADSFANVYPSCFSAISQGPSSRPRAPRISRPCDQPRDVFGGSADYWPLPSATRRLKLLAYHAEERCCASPAARGRTRRNIAAIDLDSDSVVRGGALPGR